MKKQNEVAEGLSEAELVTYLEALKDNPAAMELVKSFNVCMRKLDEANEEDARLYALYHAEIERADQLASVVDALREESRVQDLLRQGACEALNRIEILTRPSEGLSDEEAMCCIKAAISDFWG